MKCPMEQNRTEKGRGSTGNGEGGCYFIYDGQRWLGMSTEPRGGSVAWEKWLRRNTEEYEFIEDYGWE